MRFYTAASFLLAAAVAAAPPTAGVRVALASRSLVTDLGEALGQLEIHSGARATEHELDHILGGTLTEVRFLSLLSKIALSYLHITQVPRTTREVSAV